MNEIVGFYIGAIVGVVVMISTEMIIDNSDTNYLNKKAQVICKKYKVNEIGLLTDGKGYAYTCADKPNTIKIVKKEN